MQNTKDCREHVWNEVWRIETKTDLVIKQECVKCKKIQYVIGKETK